MDSSAASLSTQKAQIVFDVTPSSASISLPGLQQSLNKTDYLAKGRYLVEVSAPGFENERLWINVDNHQQQTIQLTLTPKSEPLTLDVWPPGTMMTWRNERTQGEISAKGSPMLALGRYELIFTKPGYVAEQLELEIEEGAPQALSIRLAALERKAGEVFNDVLLDGTNGPKLVVVPGGEFIQGDVQGNGDWQELPLRQVSIQSFAIGLTEVTREDYQRFALATKRQMPWEGEGESTLPVTNVSYHDALAYAMWLSEQTGEVYRLPSESEWEYAARAGQATDYSVGNEIDCEYARFGGLVRCGKAEPAPVASYAANGFGLYDVHGNVWEWTADCASEDYSNAPRDGRAYASEPCHRAMLRGGSYMLNAHKIRVSYRSWRYRDYQHSDTGFRIAREIP